MGLGLGWGRDSIPVPFVRVQEFDVICSDLYVEGHFFAAALLPRFCRCCEVAGWLVRCENFSTLLPEAVPFGQFAVASAGNVVPTNTPTD